MHFRHISAKSQPKNLKQHFDWGGPGSWASPGYALDTIHVIKNKYYKGYFPFLKKIVFKNLSGETNLFLL